MIYLVSFLLVASLAVNVVVIERFVKLAKLILRQEEAVEQCLDGLDEVYLGVGKILQLPLATNDPKVVEIHQQLKRAHGCVLRVANRLTSGWTDDDEKGPSESDDR